MSPPRRSSATLAAAGVRVAVCTDNPTVSGTRLTREYELARDLVDAATLEIGSLVLYRLAGFR